MELHSFQSQDTTAAGPQEHEWNEGGGGAELNDVKSVSSSSISSPSINSSTYSVKNKVDVDTTCVTTGQGHRKDLVVDGHSPIESESPHDPTLRPPAA